MLRSLKVSNNCKPTNQDIFLEILRIKLCNLEDVSTSVIRAKFDRGQADESITSLCLYSHGGLTD